VALIHAMQLEGFDPVICLADMKSGYHHVGVNCVFWTFTAVIIDGVYFCFPAMSFGMSRAVQIYCTIEGEKHRCLRSLGLELVQYIDDRASPYESVERALFCETLIIDLVTALGGFLSWGETTWVDGRVNFSKMQVYPLGRGIFLGYEVLVRLRQLIVPFKKVVYFKRVVQELLALETTTPRQKAKFAGLVVSFIKAVLPARLYVRTMFKAMTGVVQWDRAYSTSEEERYVMQRFLDNIDKWNGKRWCRRPVTLTLCGDASIELGAAYEVVSDSDVAMSLTDGGVLGHHMVIPIPPPVAARGSTTREVFICKMAVKIAHQVLGERLRGYPCMHVHPVF